MIKIYYPDLKPIKYGITEHNEFLKIVKPKDLPMFC